MRGKSSATAKMLIFSRVKEPALQAFFPCFSSRNLINLNYEPD